MILNESQHLQQQRRQQHQQDAMIGKAIASSWDEDSVAMAITDEEMSVSANSHEGACKVFEQWQSDGDDGGFQCKIKHEQKDEAKRKQIEAEQDRNENEDFEVILQVDEQIGSHLLEDDIFHDPCVSPSGPLKELVYVNLEIENDTDFLSFSFSTEYDEDIMETD